MGYNCYNNLSIDNFNLTKEQVGRIKSHNIVLYSEVISLKEAYDKQWADVFLLKGNEAAGRVGDETSFILAQQFADAGLSFIVQGGIGLFTSAGIFAIGAEGVVLDSQVYLTPESPISATSNAYIIASRFLAHSLDISEFNVSMVVSIPP